MAKFTKEAAIAHVMEHDPDGRRLAAASKHRQMTKLYGAKNASILKLGHDPAASRPKPFRVFTADAAPSVRTDPRNREQLDAGDARVDSGHVAGRDFAMKVKELMNSEGLSEDEAISRIYREERVAKLGW
jgi:hypothetical protein